MVRQNVKERQFTWDEIHRNNQNRAADKKAAIWVVIRDVVYDVTEFVPKHPGGAHTLEMSAGQDITYLMETSHPLTTSPWKMLETFPRLGVVTKPFVKFQESKEEPFWTELKQQTKEYFQKSGLDPKDPGPNMKVFAFILSLWVASYIGLCKGFLLGGILLGLARALFGIHTMHSASHFSLSHSPAMWKWMDWLCFDIFMGGSSLSWNFQHVLGHHQFTNVFQADPDLPCVVEGDIRRLVKPQKWKALYKFQALYLPILYSLLALKTRYSDALILLGDKSNGPLTMTVSRRDWWSLLGTKLFFVWYQFYVPLFVFGLSWGTFFKVYLAAELMAGIWLAYFFQVNHISENILYTTAEDATVKEWAALQVESTVDYAHDSWLFTFLSGTLNYQTVHHLFPSISTHHYPAITAILKPLCKKYKVKYNYIDTYWGALWAHIKELHRMGQAGIPAEYPEM